MTTAFTASVAPSSRSTPAVANGMAVKVIEASESSSGSVNRLVKSVTENASVVSSGVEAVQFVTDGAVLPTRTAMFREPETVLSGSVAGAAKSGIASDVPSMPYSMREPMFGWSFL